MSHQCALREIHHQHKARWAASSSRWHLDGESNPCTQWELSQWVGKVGGEKGWECGRQVRFMAFDLHFYDATELATAPVWPRLGPCTALW